ncbi:MAG: hypothetical protein IJ226_00135, partial [Clostridia bacterium]|nr:hypothetical protein [Clostridia bacterium]
MAVYHHGTQCQLACRQANITPASNKKPAPKGRYLYAYNCFLEEEDYTTEDVVDGLVVVEEVMPNANIMGFI